MKNFKFPYKPALTLVVAIALGFLLVLQTPHEKSVVQAQENACEIGDVTIGIDVLCWAVDAVNFTINNQLFSILDQEDLRDAVKHYRFYNLVMSELQ